jgi:hypothetical protein
MDHAQSLPWLDHAIENIDQPLHVVELQPQRVIKIDVGLVCPADAECESSRVRQVRD